MSHNTSDPSAFSLISQIYQSDLPFGLKNDCTCRILALRYNFEAASLLLYDGETDTLINRGNYISEEYIQYIGESSELGNRVKHMLKYISFYDFLYYKFYYSGIPFKLREREINIYTEEFLSEKWNSLNYRFDKSIVTKHFVKKCCDNSIILATNQIADNLNAFKLSSESFYSHYKRAFKNSEQYDIGEDVDNYSGRVYWYNLNQKSINLETHKKFYFEKDITNKEKSFIISNEHQNIFFSKFKEICNCSFEGTFQYCGIPLWANGRNLGVLRIFSKKKKDNVFHIKERLKSLRHASEIFSSFLDQTYSQEFVDRIDHDWDDETILRITNEEKKANEFCSSIRKAMDSFGSIIHLSPSPGDKPSISGRSTDSVYFKDFVTEMFEIHKLDRMIVKDHFNPLLLKLFPTSTQPNALLTREQYRLVGIHIEFVSGEQISYRVKYFYCYGSGVNFRESERVRETIEPFIFKEFKHPNIKSLFNKKFLGALRNIHLLDDEILRKNISIENVLIIDIPTLDVDGFISFYNTANRSFNLSDARFVYGEMKRLGLEISKINKEKVKNYKEISDTYFHDIKNVLKICIAQSKIFKNKPNIAIEEIGNFNYLTELLKQMQRKIESFQRLAAYNSKSKIDKYSKEWNIGLIFKKHCNSFSVIGNLFKGTQVYFEDNRSIYNKSHINQEILELCFDTLLENALKYSYGRINKFKVDGYIESDSKSNGHVHVKLWEDENNYIISFKNWGATIIDKEEIFQGGDPAWNINLFLLDENPDLIYDSETTIKLWQSSHRIGLYTLRKFVGMIDGECYCQPNDDETNFILRVRKVEKRK